MASGWADGCIYEHGLPYRPEGTIPFGGIIGQNMYGRPGSTLQDMLNGIQLWYDEKVNYDYDTASGPAGHYTQVGG